jgi:hypothetical protein
MFGFLYSIIPFKKQSRSKKTTKKIPSPAMLQTIRIRTMASDIRSMKEEGGGFPHSYTPS